MKLQSSYEHIGGRRKKILKTSLKETRRQLLEDKLNSRDNIEILLRTGQGKQEKAADIIHRVGKVRHVFKNIPYIALQTDSEDAKNIYQLVHGSNPVKSFVNSFRNLSQVVSRVEASSQIKIPEHSFRSQKYSQSDTLWSLEQIGAYDAQKIGLGRDVKIAVAGTGVDYNHPDISDKFGYNKGIDFVNGNNDPMDDNGHETMTAGLVAGNITGVSHEARLYSVKVLDQDGSGYESDSIAAVDWSIENDINIINKSLGAPSASQAYEEICKAAYNQGLVIVASAGNNSVGPSYPAAFEESVIAVAGLKKNKTRAEFSNLFHTNNCAAPGVDVPTIDLGGGYTTGTGTSFSAPLVTGGIGIVYNLLANYDIEPILESTCEILEQDPNYDYRDAFGAGLFRVDNMANSVFNKRKSNLNMPVTAKIKRLLWD